MFSVCLQSTPKPTRRSSRRWRTSTASCGRSMYSCWGPWVTAGHVAFYTEGGMQLPDGWWWCINAGHQWKCMIVENRESRSFEHIICHWRLNTAAWLPDKQPVVSCSIKKSQWSAVALQSQWSAVALQSQWSAVALQSQWSAVALQTASGQL